jgi:hypothetical protein
VRAPAHPSLRSDTRVWLTEWSRALGRPATPDGYWFSIDDHDMGSKRLFSFLMFVFTLVETGVKDGVPVLTIPTQ